MPSYGRYTLLVFILGEGRASLPSLPPLADSVESKRQDKKFLHLTSENFRCSHLSSFSVVVFLPLLFPFSVLGLRLGRQRKLAMYIYTKTITK